MADTDRQRIKGLAQVLKGEGAEATTARQEVRSLIERIVGHGGTS
jgi:hypothetical protein